MEASSTLEGKGDGATAPQHMAAALAAARAHLLTTVLIRGSSPLQEIRRRQEARC